MSDEEKKFKLDELPDKGSEPEIKPAPGPKTEKPDPRVEKMKSMSNKERVEAIGQRWYFDKPVYSWGWLVVLLLLFALEKSGHMEQYQKQRDTSDEQTDGISGGVIDAFGIDALLRHPLYLAILIPLFFKYRESSQVFFEITFDGISSVRSIEEAKTKKPLRKLVKWNEISEVKKGKAGSREILEICSVDGPLIEIIWDIEDVKKKVIKQIVKGLVSNKNPFRVFIEKEVA